MEKRVVVIGTGNVATHLTEALLSAGLPVAMLFSRTPRHAAEAGQRFQLPYTSDWSELPSDAGYYIYSVSDTALPEVLDRNLAPGAIHIHTAGSIGMDVFGATKPRHGVLYPLQTFSKNKALNFKDVPLFIEASSPEVLGELNQLASLLSTKVRTISTAQRRQLHLAAVYACNFVNHLYAVADELVQDSGLPFEVLIPLINETAAKVSELTPRQAQTGPALRGDRGVMDKHLALLHDHPQFRELYTLLSKSIADKGSSNL